MKSPFNHRKYTEVLYNQPLATSFLGLQSVVRLSAPNLIRNLYRGKQRKENSLLFKDSYSLKSRN